MRKLISFFVFMVSVLFCESHEYMLISENYFLQKGDPLYVHVFVAEGFNVILERPLQKGITRNFNLDNGNKTKNLLQTVQDGALPVIEDTVDFDGLALLSMERDYARIELPPSKFAEYIKEDHLDNIVFDKNSAKANQREKYSRYLKCLIISGDDTNSDIYKKELHHELEIILLDNPYTLHTGENIRALIMFRGEPLTGVIVTARNRSGDDNTISETAGTDTEGIAHLPITKSGTWVLHLTYMIPCTDATDCDWESFWASYSFGIKN